jgi:hypothetical protein
MTFIFLAVPWIANDPRRRVIFFALAWGAPLWIAAELLTQKLPQYVLPAIPVIAMVAGAAIDAGEARIRGKVSLFYSAGPLVWPPLVALVVPFVFLALEGWYPAVAFAFFLVGAVLGPAAWFWLREGRAVAAAVLSAATVLFIYLGFFGRIVPDLQGLRVAERIVSLGSANLQCADPIFAVAGFPEESAVLAAGPQTLLTDGSGAADFLDQAGCRVAAVASSQISSFRQHADDLGLEPVEHGRFIGLNLRKVSRVEIHLFSVKGGGA